MKTGMQALISKINEDGERHSAQRYTQIKSDIDAETDRENALYCADFGNRRELLKKHHEHEYARLSERMSSRLNRELMTYQHELLDEIFDMAAAKLRDIPNEEFAALFQAAVKGLSGSFTLYLGALSAGKLTESAIAEAAAANDGLHIALSARTIPQKSGFVIEDDRVEYNCLFEDLIEDKKTERAAEILKEVFLTAES